MGQRTGEIDFCAYYVVGHGTVEQHLFALANQLRGLFGLLPERRFSRQALHDLAVVEVFEKNIVGQTGHHPVDVFPVVCVHVSDHRLYVRFFNASHRGTRC